MFRPSRPLGGAAPAAGPLDATVVGAAPDAAWPPLRALPSPDVAGRGHAARDDSARSNQQGANWWSAGGATGAANAARNREEGAPHGEPDEVGRGHAARADVVAARGPWDVGRREHQPRQKPSQHARRRGLRPHSESDRAGRGNAAHGPHGQSCGGGSPVRS